MNLQNQPHGLGCIHNSVDVINSTKLCIYEWLKWSTLCIFYYTHTHTWTHTHTDPTTLLAHTSGLNKGFWNERVSLMSHRAKDSSS